MWPDRRITELFGIEHPILLAPMAGPSTAELGIAVSEAGGLGAFACAMSTPEQVRTAMSVMRQRTSKPINLNFFTHIPPVPDAAREARWKARLGPYYAELGVDPEKPVPSADRAPFGEATCRIVEEFKPEVVSFHFGLPEDRLLQRVRAAGARIIASATTAREARWLAERGCDAIIAQGAEAGGHRGMFLTDDVASQAGTFALVPQVVDAVEVPVIAAGGIADGRGIAAAFALGASAVQVGTAYLFCPEARMSELHRNALRSARDDDTALTNIFSGRPARGILNRVMRELGPMSGDAPAFPLAGGALAPLRAAAEAKGSGDFTSLWSGQSASLCHEMPAAQLTQELVREALDRLKAIGG
ncbi:MAG: nitronate monooxygenase family protein [Hyphomicrobiaceae bacterium]|nr:nitronate monooxygenase family protein [Hyphomicrobiaceae bacterium]